MPVRVLVVDDSAFMRRVIREAIAAESDLEVVGTAHDGLEALLLVEREQPDVVTLDVEMPRLDGLTTLRYIMERYPRPVVMLSSLTQAGAVTTLRALHIGAVDFVAKPSGAISLDFDRVREELIAKIRVAARARVVRRPRTLADPVPADARPPARLAPGGHVDRVVLIGASTGGPRALATVVPALPVEPATGYVVVQHMPAGFTRSLAERLDSFAPLQVREAVDGDRLAPGLALLAPGDYHLHLRPGGRIALDQAPRVHGVRPSVDVALTSAAQAYGPRVVAAILTGMGQDGADGADAVRRAGGTVVAEDESTCVVWGMPRAVAERGLAQRIVPLPEIAGAIADVLSGRSSEKKAFTHP